MHLNPCNCGSRDIKQYNPYGVESVRCNECHVSLRLVDWNRIMVVHATACSECKLVNNHRMDCSQGW